MVCDELMERDVAHLTPDATIEEAARLMEREGVGFLPICDDTGKVLGTLTDRDIVVRGVARGRGGEVTVSETMTEDVLGCQPSDDVSCAERIMRDHKVSRVMCLDEDGRLAGVISLADLAEAGRIRGPVAEIKEGQGPHAH
jgi:CBS domain-containing protein